MADGLRETGVDVRTGREGERRVARRTSEVTVELEGGEAAARRAAARRGRAAAATPTRSGSRRWGSSRASAASCEVDDQLRVDGSEWLYAIGDVNGRALLTHMGKYQARIAGDHDPRQGRRGDREDRRAVPRVVFTEPQVAAVGRTLAAAAEAGIDARAVDVADRGHRGRELHGRNAPGTTRLVVDEDRRVLVGRDVRRPRDGRAGARGDDRRRRRGAAGAAVARGRRVPTRSEVWLKLLEEYGL